MTDTESKADIERRAEQRGMIIQGLADLKETVDKGFEDVKERFDKGEIRFNNLPCEENIETLNKLDTWFNKREKLKAAVIKFLSKRLLPSGVTITALVGAAFAYFKG